MSKPFISSDKPMKNQIETERPFVIRATYQKIAYQKMIFSTINTTTTTPAQNSGFW